MNVRILSVVGLGLVLSDCSGGPCGGQTCTDAQRCTSTQICVADESPTLALELPIENQMVTGATVMVKGTANDDTAVAQLKVAFGSALPVTIPFPGSGTFAAEVDVPTADAKPVQLTVTAMDPKRKGVSVTRTIQVDNVAPTCAMSVPAVVTSVGDFVVMTTAADGSGTLTNARFSSDGALTFTPVTGSAFTWVVNTENGVMHALVFRIEDGAGHVCEAKADVLVDNVKPTVGFTSPDAGALLGKAFFLNGGVLSGPASDGARPLKTVMVEFADAGVHQAAVANDQWSLAVAAPVTDDFALESATVTATDFADNTASATLSVTVDVVPPVLAVTAPAMNAKLNIASFPAGDDVAVAFTVSDGDSQTAAVLLAADGGVLPSGKVTTAATDNPKSYAATVRVTDRAGNSGTAPVAFSVDRVAPTLVSSVPSNNTRMHVGPASAIFSEPMAAGPEGLRLTPDAGGSWTTTTTWTTQGLSKDEIYSATSGAADLFGNPVTPTAFKFHTETWIPDAGDALASPVAGVDFATADQEGVLSMLVHNPADAGFWVMLSPRTGQATILPLMPASGKLMTAWRTVNPDLSSRRLVGLTLVGPSGPQVAYALDGVTTLGPNDEVFIPTPAFVGEGVGLGEFATIRRNGAALEYVRSGRASMPLDVTAVDEVRITPKRWELFVNSFTGVFSQTYGCVPSVIGGAPPICELRPVDSVFGMGNPRVEATSTNCTVVSPSTGPMTTHFNPWQPECGTFGRPACVAKSTASAAARDLVADLSNDGTFYSVEGTGPYQVRKLMLDGACTGAWANVGGPVPLATKPVLVVIRGVPMLVYADGNGNLKLAAP